MNGNCAPSCFYGSNNHSDHLSRQAREKCRLHNELRIVLVRNEHAAASKSFGPSRVKGPLKPFDPKGRSGSVRPSKAH
jgi:hypothetical protein